MLSVLSLSMALMAQPDVTQHMTSNVCFEQVADGATTSMCAKKLSFPKKSHRFMDGYCHINLTIAPDGSVAKAKVIGTRGSNHLKYVCMRRPFKWAFTPPERDGVPVTTPVKNVQMVISLVDHDPSRNRTSLDGHMETETTFNRVILIDKLDVRYRFDTDSIDHVRAETYRGR